MSRQPHICPSCGGTASHVFMIIVFKKIIHLKWFEHLGIFYEEIEKKQILPC